MKIIPYDKTMRETVIDLCIRNYSNNQPRDYWETVIDTITGYQWNNRIDYLDIPFRDGMVLINDSDTVVGYMGLIFSKQCFEKKEYTVVNATTLVIDKAYGFYLTLMLAKMHSLADIVLDVSPIPALRKVLKERLNYVSVEDEYYSFLPFFSLRSDGVKIRMITNEAEIQDSETQTKYADHIKYGVKCLEVKNKYKTSYLLLKYVTGTRRMGFRISNVLYSSDSGSVQNNIKSIIWYLFIYHHCFLVSDKRFVGEMPDSKFIKKHSQECLVFSIGHIPEGINYLYTEKPMFLL